MYSKEDIKNHLRALGVNPRGTLLLHSSVKSVGEVEGRADGLLDAFVEYMEDGLLVLPTHSWEYISSRNKLFDVNESPSCVGLLTELFRKRPGVIRSWHPTHSTAALGRDASAFTENDTCDTPCSRKSPWGRLLDRNAQILFLGTGIKCNTYLHAVEEWENVPDRIADRCQRLKVKTPNGDIIDAPLRRHKNSVSENYGKMEPVFLKHKAAVTGKIGDAFCYLCDAAKIYEITAELLSKNPRLFSDGAPVPEDFY